MKYGKSEGMKVLLLLRELNMIKATALRRMYSREMG